MQQCIRKSSGGFKTNIALGADPELCEITKEMEDMAAKASKAMGGGILGDRYDGGRKERSSSARSQQYSRIQRVSKSCTTKYTKRNGRICSKLR